jgi:acid stress-induced BolA-like protein IbaG/YrbA
MDAEQVKALLQEGLPGCDVSVDYDGYYFNILVVGDVFEGLRKVQRQQKVLGLLQEQFASGAIHAVKNIATYTPAERP